MAEVCRALKAECTMLEKMFARGEQLQLDHHKNTNRELVQLGSSMLQFEQRIESLATQFSSSRTTDVVGMKVPIAKEIDQHLDEISLSCTGQNGRYPPSKSKEQAAPVYELAIKTIDIDFEDVPQKDVFAQQQLTSKQYLSQDTLVGQSGETELEREMDEDSMASRSSDGNAPLTALGGKMCKGAGSTFFENSLARSTRKVSCWQHLLNCLGYDSRHLKQPDTWLAKKVNSTSFGLVCSVITIVNALVIGLETDLSMRGALSTPPSSSSVVFFYIDLSFAVWFTAELLVRMWSHGSWFLASPADWRWNLLDAFLVATAIFAVISDFLGKSTSNLTFLRILRVFRVVRIARVVRVARFCKEMRKMMFSIMACTGSLIWSFIFLLMIMFMFSIFFMQGAITHIEETEYNDDVRLGFKEYYGTLYDCMFALLAAILGGADWLDILRPIAAVSQVYRLAFAFYVVFVVLGVLNILTGVFLESAKDFKDRDLVVQQEITRMDNFIGEMLDLFHEFDPHETGKISYENFSIYIADESVQAYLTSHLLDTTHADMLYHLLDRGNLGDINIHDFIHGLLRLKGAAKELDTRVLLHEVRTLKVAIKSLHHEWQDSRKTSGNKNGLRI